MVERRQHNRIKVTMKASYHDGAYTNITANVLNISKGGMYIQDACAPDLHETLVASLDAEDIGKVIWVEGQVVRKTGTGMGIMFTKADAKGLDNLLISRSNVPDIANGPKDTDEALHSLREHRDDTEHIRIQVLGLVTKCIEDIQKVVSSSGLHMRDVGVGIDNYKTSTGSTIIELRLIR